MYHEYKYNKKEVLRYIIFSTLVVLLCVVPMSIALLTVFDFRVGGLKFAVILWGVICCFIYVIPTMRVVYFSLTYNEKNIEVKNDFITSHMRIYWNDINKIDYNKFQKMLILESTTGKKIYLRRFFNDYNHIQCKIVKHALFVNSNIHLTPKASYFLSSLNDTDEQ